MKTLIKQTPSSDYIKLKWSTFKYNLISLYFNIYTQVVRAIHVLPKSRSSHQYRRCVSDVRHWLSLGAISQYIRSDSSWGCILAIIWLLISNKTNILLIQRNILLRIIMIIFNYNIENTYVIYTVFHYCIFTTSWIFLIFRLFLSQKLIFFYASSLLTMKLTCII